MVCIRLQCPYLPEQTLFDECVKIQQQTPFDLGYWKHGQVEMDASTPYDWSEYTAYDIYTELLDLDDRVRNALFRFGLRSVGDLVDILHRGDDFLLPMRNFNSKDLIDVKEQLKKYGFLHD